MATTASPKKVSRSTAVLAASAVVDRTIPPVDVPPLTPVSVATGYASGFRDLSGVQSGVSPGSPDKPRMGQELSQARALGRLIAARREPARLPAAPGPIRSASTRRRTRGDRRRAGSRWPPGRVGGDHAGLHPAAAGHWTRARATETDGEDSVGSPLSPDSGWNQTPLTEKSLDTSATTSMRRRFTRQSGGRAQRQGGVVAREVLRRPTCEHGAHRESVSLVHARHGVDPTVDERSAPDPDQPPRPRNVVRGHADPRGQHRPQDATVRHQQRLQIVHTVSLVG